MLRLLVGIANSRGHVLNAVPELYSVRSCHNQNTMSPTQNRLIRPDFGRLAVFGLVVHGDFTIRNYMLALPAAIRNASQFEQITERNMICTQYEFNGFYA